MSTLCPASSSLLSTLDRFDCLHAKEKQSLLHSECGCTGRWTRLKPKMTVGKLWRWIQNVCVFIVYAIRCEWFPHKTLFLPVYIGSLFQFWLQRISNQHVFSTAFFFVLVFWVIIFFSKRCTETLFLSSCHCGICLLKRTRWALRVVACDFHK